VGQAIEALLRAHPEGYGVREGETRQAKPTKRPADGIGEAVEGALEDERLRLDPRLLTARKMATAPWMDHRDDAPAGLEAACFAKSRSHVFRLMKAYARHGPSEPPMPWGSTSQSVLPNVANSRAAGSSVSLLAPYPGNMSTTGPPAPPARATPPVANRERPETCESQREAEVERGARIRLPANRGPAEKHARFAPEESCASRVVRAVAGS